MRKNKGITLVALVVTIIILLILASISIATLTGRGLFEKAKLAEKESKEKQEIEEQTLGDYENKINQYLDTTRGNITLYKRETITNGETLVPDTITSAIEMTLEPGKYFIYGTYGRYGVTGTKAMWVRIGTGLAKENMQDIGYSLIIDSGKVYACGFYSIEETKTIYLNYYATGGGTSYDGELCAIKLN